MAVVGDSFIAKLVEEAYGLLKDEVVARSGAAPEIQRLQDTFRSIRLVLADADRRRSKFGFITEIPSVCPPQISRCTSHLVDPDIVGSGIEEDKDKLVELLIEDGQNENLIVHSIVGIGGTGKTTLARSTYNDERITAHFKIKMWLSVSQDFTDVDLLRSIARMLFDQYPFYGGGILSGNVGRDCLEPAINRVVRGRRFFLVLDDLWSEEVWYDLLRNPLQGCAAGSRILITTRNVGVAKKIGTANIHMMRLMSDEDGWALLRKKVTFIGEESDVDSLEDIGLEIVQKCAGLPLAVKSIGGVLRIKKKSRKVWENILQNANWSVNWLPEGVHAALYLSYEDLPYHLKECFLHVCLFPSAPFFQKRDVIQYWIAEGFIKDHDHSGQTLEDLGMEYYFALIERGLLQPDPLCYDCDISRVHDLVQLLAQFLAQGESLVRMQHKNWIAREKYEGSSCSNSVSVKPRRISGEIKPMLDLMQGGTQLRTLILRSSKLEDEDINYLVKNATRLRVLNLRWSKITKLPGSIGLMIHLRLLVLTDSTITELPESICDLVNLQFLRTQGCKQLCKLPNGIFKLRRLRCLDLYDTKIECLPQGIAQLHQLNALLGFVVNDPSSLAELRTLTSLRTLAVHRVERAIIDTFVLSEMVQLKYLKLDIKIAPQPRHMMGQYTVHEINKIQEILEVTFLPPPNIEVLEISKYHGRQLPSWLMLNTASSFLPQLRWLKLYDCPLIEQLPPVGVLPNLEHFEIRDAYKIKTVGIEFFGQSSSSPFPKLTTLMFHHLSQWEEWEIGENYGPRAFPKLQFLEIERCSLKSFPTQLSCGSVLLKKLCIKRCRGLSEISGFPYVEKLILINNALPRFTALSALKILVLEDEKLDSFPDWFYEASSKLQKLIIICSLELLRRCLMGGPDWPTVQQIPFVYIHSRCTNNYLRKSPSSYNTGTGSASCLESYCHETDIVVVYKIDYLVRQWGELI